MYVGHGMVMRAGEGLTSYSENDLFKNGSSPAQYFFPTTRTKALCVRFSTLLATMLQQKTP